METKLQRDLFVIEYEPGKIDPAAMVEEIDALGFTARELSQEEGSAEPEPVEETPERSALVEELLARAQRENKPVVLEFSGRFCAACTRLEKETLSDPRVKQALGNVIFQKIMVEEHRAAARQFGVHAIPQLRFLSPKGEVVAKAMGVIPVKTILRHLEELDSGG